MSTAFTVTSLQQDEQAPHGLPETLAERIAAMQHAPGRIVLIARRGDRSIGVLVARRRRTTTMLRIVLFWVLADEVDHDAVSRQLVSALEQLSLATDVLTWRISADASEADIPFMLRAIAHIGAAGPDALYSERHLTSDGLAGKSTTPIYTQTTRFTCGAACLMMAFAGLDASIPIDRQLEITLWREATSVVSKDGPGGCDPYGLALAAAARGYRLRVFMSTPDAVLVDRGNTDEKRELIKFVQADFKRRVLDAGIQVEARAFLLGELRDAIAAGAVAAVLIDQMETHGRTVPHWVLAHAVSEDHFLVNDPWFEASTLETIADVVDLPIRDAMFERMAWYGEPRYRAALLIDRPAG